MRRIFAYLLLIPLAVLGLIMGADRWQQKTQQRSFLKSFMAPYWVSYYMKEISHPNAKVASYAYWQLNNLYFSHWSAVDLIKDQVSNAAPISFLIEEDTFAVPGQAAKRSFSASAKPIYYKSERVYARTVGEAFRTILYREYAWKRDFDGDWDQWWQANKGYYAR